MLIEQAFPKGTKYRRDQYLPPNGVLLNNFTLLMEDGCIQAESEGLRPLFALLMGATGNNPCNGCPVWDSKGPGCKAFQNHHSAYLSWKQTHDDEIRTNITPHNAPEGHRFAGMNMKQIAGALGISLSEARRRKQAGTLFTSLK